MSFAKTLMASLALVTLLCVAAPSASATPEDCLSSTYGCEITVTSDSVEFVDTDLQTVSSATNMGTSTSAYGSILDETRVGVCRDNVYYIRDLFTGSVCQKTLTDGCAGAVIRSNWVYVGIPSQDQVAVFADDCTGTVTYLSVGNNPGDLVTDGTLVWTINGAGDDISEINSSDVVTPRSLGLSGVGLAYAWYDNGSIYIGSVNGIYKVTVPGYATSLWFDSSQFGDTLYDIDGHSGWIAGFDNATDKLYIIDQGNTSNYQVVTLVASDSVTVGESADGVTVYTEADWGQGGFPFTTWVWGHQTSGAVATYNPLYSYGGSGTDPYQILDVMFIHPTSTTPVCGNSVVESGETCDDGGTTPGDGCNASCQEESGWTCTGQPSSCTEDCGDATIVGGELCDGVNHGGNDCTTVPGGFTGGTLACNGTCDGWNTSSCTSYVCGNSSIEPGEDCDLANLGGQDCTDRGFNDGILACDGGCNWDTSGCFDYVCGNNSIEPGEDCDNSNLGGQNCTTVPGGFTGGTLACTAGSCDWDVSSCWTCGDGAINTGEQCDDTNVGGQDCTSLGLGTGSVTCNLNCTFNTSQCTSPPVCQNGTQEPGEQCDSADMGAQPNCTDHGFDSGSLACTTSCTYDTSGCINDPVCQNGVREGSEECDQLDLNGFDCTTIPGDFTGGTLGCSSSCTFDSSSCTETQECQDATYITLEVPSITTDTDAEAAKHQTAVDLYPNQQCDSGCIVEDGHELTWISTQERCISTIAWNGVEEFTLTTELYSEDGEEEAILFFRTDAPHEFLQIADGEHIEDHNGEDILIWYGWRGVIAAVTGGTGSVGGLSPIHPITLELSPLIDLDQPDLGTVNMWWHKQITRDLYTIGVATIPFDSDSIQFKSYSSSLNQVHVIDENNPEQGVESFDIPETPDPPKKKKCSCSADGSPAGALPIFLAFILIVWSTRRKRNK